MTLFTVEYWGIMSVARRWASAGLAILVVASALAIAPSASAAPPGDNWENMEGDRHFAEPPSEDILGVAAKVQALTAGHLDEILGTAITSDGTMLEVYTTNPEGEAARAIAQELTHDELKSVRIIESAFSFNEYDAVALEISRTNEDNDTFVSVGLDVIDQSLTIGVEPESEAGKVSLDEGDDINPAARNLPSAYAKTLESILTATDLPVTFEVMTRPEASGGSRRAPTSPFDGGAQMYLAPGGNIVCSTGFRVRVNGIYYMLTAGHCGNGEFRTAASGGSLMGRTKTSSFSWDSAGTLRTYGDFQLLAGASYSDDIFYGSNTTSSLASMVEAVPEIAPPTVGTFRTISGRTTGTTHRYFINAPHVYVNLSFKGSDGTERVKSVAVSNMKRFNEDRTAYVCGATFGDSGGAVYIPWLVSPQAHTMSGVFTGMTTPASNTNCTFYYSGLFNIAKWNDSITL